MRWGEGVGIKGDRVVRKRLLKIEFTVRKKKVRHQDRSGRGSGIIAVVVAPANEFWWKPDDPQVW
jgi:hypothetical protein